jgi:DNA-binding NarL/FixJ family response regulator
MSGRTAVVVDHHPLWLRAIEQTLVAASVEVVATTTSLEEATELVEQFAPDLLVVEIAIREGEPSFGAETRLHAPTASGILVGWAEIKDG